jgi:2-dehydropantoate 2-reductase
VKFAVVGAGAIGAYVGASLSAGGADVTLIARGPHLRAMQEHGVRVLSPRGDFTAKPQATDDLGAVADADAVFLGLKAYSLPEVASRLGEVVQPDAAVVCAQNGIPYWYFHDHGGPLDGTTLESVDPGGVITDSMPAGSAIGCVVYCAAEIEEPGVIRHVEGRRFPICEPDGSSSARCHAISDAFRAGGLRAPVDPRLRDQIWLKLVGNAALNPVSALTGATLAELGRSPSMVELLGEMLAEGAAVAERLGVELPVSLERRLEAAFEVGEHRTSMLMDREAGKPLEHQCITGAIIELADRLDVAVPRLKTVHECIAQVDTLREAKISR